MSSGADLRFSHALGLVTKLSRTVADFSKREGELTATLSAKHYQEVRRHREAMHREDTSLAAAIAAVESDAARQMEQVQTTLEKRRGRVQRAHGLLKRTLPKRAADAKGNWLADLQMRKLRADRMLASASAETDGEFKAMSNALQQQHAVLGSLTAETLKAFRGYPSLAEHLVEKDSQSHGGEVRNFLPEIESRIAAAAEQLARFRELRLPAFFSSLPLAVGLMIALLAGGAVVALRGFSPPLYVAGGMTAMILAAVLIAAYVSGAGRAKEEAVHTGAAALDAYRILRAGISAAAAHHKEQRDRSQAEHEQACAEIEAKWESADEVEKAFEANGRRKLEPQLPRLLQKIEARLQREQAKIRQLKDSKVSELKTRADEKRSLAESDQQQRMNGVAQNETARWAALEADWKTEIDPLFDEVHAMNESLRADFPRWDAQVVDSWRPAAAFSGSTKFGELALDFSNKDGPSSPRLLRLEFPRPPKVSIPAALTYPEQGSLLIETRESCGGPTIDLLNNVMLRLLATTPPGKISFTIIDPVGLGENFAGFMHLGDYEEGIINRRIWTQRDQIDERLLELNAHIEKVIQMYLRNEYANITEYNAQAGSVAEKYHFLVVADFPAGFSESAAQRIQSIAVSGARCGVFTLIHRDARQSLPEDFSVEELRKGSVHLQCEAGVFSAGRQQAESGAALLPDAPPGAHLSQSLVHRIGKSSVDSNRVQVPFAHIAPAPEEYWTNETTHELRIPIGRTGATKMQYLAIGKGTRQHALFAGKTGSGKSTLFHVIITNLALACSPEQVEFYLIDFKKGVEFKCYANKQLPHARVVAIESDREFALSVLQRVDEELKRRGDLFRTLNVQDVAGYKRAGGTEPMPRSLLLIDEFQEFFVEDDAIAQTASLLFDRIVRQGRAFGIHVILGSQTLGGAFTLARATMGQMVIRVALQCNEADAYLIMDENNSAPRLLSRPGEGIYNDSAGAIEGNSPFQVVWLSDEERDAYLEKIRTLADARGHRHRSAIVFEGNAPSSVEENNLLSRALEDSPASVPESRCWFGAPNSIKGPTEVLFRRQSGNHLLIVGQREEAALTMILVSLIALAAQHPAGKARFIVIHGSAEGSQEAQAFERLSKTVLGALTVATAVEIPEVIRQLSVEMKARASGETPLADAPSEFVFIHGLHKFKKLRHEDDFSFGSGEGEASPGAAFTDLISEGSALGIHVIATVDSFNNVNRSMSRKALSEFEMRIVFQMSANDSAGLIDSPKAGSLGLHRALLYNEQAGTLETFRPYAMPDGGWFALAAALLAKRDR